MSAKFGKYKAILPKQDIAKILWLTRTSPSASNFKHCPLNKNRFARSTEVYVRKGSNAAKNTLFFLIFEQFVFEKS